MLHTAVHRLFLLAGRSDANRHRMEKSVDPLSVPVLLLIISALGATVSMAYYALSDRLDGYSGDQVLAVPFTRHHLLFPRVCTSRNAALLIISAYRNRAAGWVIVGIILLLGNGVFDSAVKASRSALLLPVLVAFFSVCCRWIPVSFAACHGGCSYIAPDNGRFALYRPNSTVPADKAKGLVSALAHVLSASGDPLSSLFIGIKFVLYRIPGYDLMVGILGHGMTPLGMAAFDVFRSGKGGGRLSTVEGFLFSLGPAASQRPWFCRMVVPGWRLATGGNWGRHRRLCGAFRMARIVGADVPK